MKKLMFAAVAMAAAGAMAVESANVVGYESYDASQTDDMATIGDMVQADTDAEPAEEAAATEAVETGDAE